MNKLIVFLNDGGFKNASSLINVANKLQKKTLIISYDYKSKTFPDNLNTDYVFLKFIDKFDLESIDNILKMYSNIYSLQIYTFCENWIQLTGFFNTKYKSKDGIGFLTATLFSDKYYMKSMASDNSVVSEINTMQEIYNFVYQNEAINRWVIKPRKRDSAEGIFFFEKTNLNKENVNDYLIEPEIEYQRMISFDGIFKNNKICIGLIHHYTEKITDILNNKSYVSVHSESVLKSDDSFQIFSEGESILQKLSFIQNQSWTSPFHMEFFVTNDGKYIFNEVGARFGGAGIADLMSVEISKNIKEIFWYSVFNPEYIPTLKKLKIRRAASYLPFKKKGEQVPTIDSTPKWISSIKYFVNPGEVIDADGTSLNSQMFQLIFLFDNLNDYNEKVNYLDSLVRLKKKV